MIGQVISAAYRLPSSTTSSARQRKGRQPKYSSPIILKLNNDWAKQDHGRSGSVDRFSVSLFSKQKLEYSQYWVSI